jgi:hypothetical protein
LCPRRLSSWLAVANPLTESEKLFLSYLETHGYIAEHDLDWRERFPDVETAKSPDFLVSRAGDPLAICEQKEWESSPVDRRLAVQRFGSFSSEEVHQTAADAVQDAAREQLRPFAGVGLPLVVVLANPHHRVVPLGPGDMHLSLFGTSDRIVAGPGGLVRRVSDGVGALAATDANGVLYNPHTHLSAVVVVHERTMEQDFVDEEFAAKRPPEPPRTESERHAQATSMLAGINDARREGRIPSGSYEWVEVFDLSGLGAGFDGTPLPDNIFDRPRDRWYVVTDHGFVERTVPAQPA